MGLVLRFTKRQQKYKPVIVQVTHNGETMLLEASSSGNIIQLHFEGPKSFRVERSNFVKENLNDLTGK